MKLLLDMNLSPGRVRTLADKGLEAVHWILIGAATASDPEIRPMRVPPDTLC